MNDQENIIQCRASVGVAIPASQPWEAGKTVEFIYAPAGKHLITAGFRKGESITICVENDEQTVADLQESFDHLTATEPNQEPFSDEDHDAKKATMRFPAGTTKFTWGQIKSNQGIIVAAEPTSYGAEAVNGKVYRSWSPEFATDADYSKAKLKAGHWTFPEGVKGSESNPARITGVSFVMGALTNRPAFKAMPPVKAKKADGGSKIGWEKGGEWNSSDFYHERAKANSHSTESEAASERAEAKPSAENLAEAEVAHTIAGIAHKRAAEVALGIGHGGGRAQHLSMANHHKAMADHYNARVWAEQGSSKPSVMSSQPLSLTTLATNIRAAIAAEYDFQELKVLAVNHDDGEYSSTIQCGAGQLEVGFLIEDDGTVKLNGEPVKATGIINSVEGEVLFREEKVKAAEPNDAWGATEKAFKTNSPEDHERAASLHEERSKNDSETSLSAHPKMKKYWENSARVSKAQAKHHRELAKSISEYAKASSPDLDSIFVKAEAQEPKNDLESIFARVGKTATPAAAN